MFNHESRLRLCATAFTSVCSGGAGVGPSATPAQAQTTIDHANFNGLSGDLNGTTPTITISGATWDSAAGLFTETLSGGSAPGTVTVAGHGPTRLGPGAFLPFTVNGLSAVLGADAIIDLRVTMNATRELNPANSSTKRDW